MTVGEHLEVLRRMLLKVLFVFLFCSILIFCFKREVFSFILAPKSSSFVSFDLITDFLRLFSPDFSFSTYDIPLISTELSSQFMSHIYVSCILGLLVTSPYILYELLKFITPALYENEKRYSAKIAIVIFILFIVGVLMSYYILFPISFRFLATYQVDESVVSTITLDSYISTFASLTFLTAIVFQLPVITYLLGKIGLISPEILIKWRPYAFVLILLVAAIITPPDIFTLLIVSFPIFGLYELSIFILRKSIHNSSNLDLSYNSND